MKKKILLIILLVVISLSLGVYFLSKSETKTKLSLENNNMLSFTVDGVESKTMPTKGSKYIASKITCTKGSIIVFDNDNWTIEVEKLETDDACKIDFTKGIGNNTVTVTINDTSKIDSTSKTTTEGGKVVFYVTEEPDSITGGEYTLTDNKLIVGNVTANVNLTFSLRKTLYSQLLEDNPTISTRTDFSTAFKTNTVNTLYKAKEDNKDVYYFAGQDTESTPINNWVKFGGYYWRIIRTNSDGGVRLLYSGTSPDTTEGTSAFNSTVSDPIYVGYMYGTSGSLENNRTNTNDSTIKTYIDNWYKNNLTDYTKFLSSDAVYCNDRNLANGQTYSTTDGFDYASYKRLYTNKQPTYNCTNMSDAFSASNADAKLTYPIGLMTADETIYAGGSVSDRTNSKIWFELNSNKKPLINAFWWLMTPFVWNEGSLINCYQGNGRWTTNLNSNSSESNQIVRPVTSLKSCVKYSSGDGTPENPYTILETETGC